MQFWSKITTALMPGGDTSCQGPRGARAYGVGDIHGRLDLLDDLLEQIEDDIRRRPCRKHYIVFLGDLIDRGPDSAGVVERLRTYRPADARPVFLAGNHEEVLLRVVDGEPEIMEHWLKFGGSECVASYGVEPARLAGLTDAEASRLVRDAVPREHVEFIRGFGDTFRFGSYLFVHAGIRPGIALEQQNQRDLRWIREPFLSDTKGHGFVIVHGHTIVEAVEEKANRVAIDTGAVHSGVLTAIVVEETSRRFLATKGVSRVRAAAA